MTVVDLLPATLRRELDRLRFEVKRVPPGGRRAERSSRQRGTGLEFVDFRGYVPGDDFRALDWHAYVKHNRLVLKQYEEQQDLPVYVLLDASASMQSSSKHAFTQQLAAAFGYLGLANEDRVAVFPFAEAPLPPLRPLIGRNVINRLIDYLSRSRGGQQTNLVRALDDLAQRAKRRGIVVLLSDFFAPGDLAPVHAALRRLRHDVAVVLVTDQAEVYSLPDGDLLLEDCETGETVAVTLTPLVRAEFVASYREFVEELAAFCRRSGIAFQQAALGDSVGRVVGEVVRQVGR